MAIGDGSLVLPGRNSSIVTILGSFPGTQVYIPAVVRSGLLSVIRHAQQTPVDGHPALTGGQIETELRYYYNFYFAHEQITFDSFLAEAARQVQKVFADIDLTLDWVKSCDRHSQLRAARRRADALRRSFRDETPGPEFWDQLWNLQKVFLGAFRIKPVEIDLSRGMLAKMCRSQLLLENRRRVEELKTALDTQNERATRRLFLIIDDFLNGIPLPIEEFLRHTNGYTPQYAYKAYAAVAADTLIRPDEIGWSWSSHALLRRRFGIDAPRQPTQNALDYDPTATADEVADVHVFSMAQEPALPRDQATTISRRRRSISKQRSDREVLAKLSAVLSILFDGDEYGMADLVADGLG